MQRLPPTHRPGGLCLENFDPIGGWHQHCASEVLRTSDRFVGVLQSEEAFQDVADLKRILVENHRDKFARNLTEKLLTYATGRLIERSDEPAVKAIVEKLDRQGGGLRDLVAAKRVHDLILHGGNRNELAPTDQSAV